MSSNADFTEIKEGMMLSGCRVVAKIGEGGMGSVYRAIDENLERIVAIKVMRRQAGHDDMRERFQREAKVAAKLIDPGIAQVFTAGEHGDLLYYIMEFVDGSSLDSFLKKARLITSGKHDIKELILAGYIKEPDPSAPYFLRDLASSPLSDPAHLNFVKDLVTAVAETLSAVHASGSVHRDIKPSNIMISKKNEIKLVDFGLVKRAIDPEITQMDQFVGTFGYMAPEQFLGKKGRVTHATDIYSLGVVFYELAALVKPVEEDELAALINAVTNGEIEDPRKHNDLISPQLSAVIMKCLSKDPARRYANASELASAIRSVETAVPIFTNIKNFFYGFFGPASRRDVYGIEPRSAINATEAQETAGARQSGTSLSRASLASNNDGIVSDGAARASASLLSAARDEYFAEFVNEAVKNKLEQALDLNPLNAEALLFYFLLLNHNMIERAGFDSAWKAVLPHLALFSERDKMIFDIIEASHVKNDLKAASGLSIRYHHLYPDDLLMVVLMCHIEAELSNFQRTLDYCDEIAAKYPDFVITRLFAADIQAGMGDMDKCMEILEEVSKKHPANSGCKIVAIQNLFSSGRLDEVDKIITESEKAGQNEEIFSFFKPKLFIHRGKIKEAITDIRKNIGLEENQSAKSYLYYMLYRIHMEQDEKEKAREYLRMANKFSSANNFKSFEDIKNDIASISFAGFAPENILPAHFNEALKHAREIGFSTLSTLNCLKFSNLATMTYYHITASDACEKVVIYSSYRYSSEPESRNQIYLDSPPISPFVDFKGNLLESTCKKCPAPFGNFLAVINYAAPQRGGEAMFFMAQFESEALDAENKGGETGGDEFKIFKTSGFAYWNALYHGIVISFPAELVLRSVSCPPDRIVEADNRKFYFYTKFLFAGQRFPIEITFDK